MNDTVFRVGPVLPSDDQRALRVSLGLVAAISMVLQAWRPFYHLTDDNLSGWLPAATEFNRRLLAGRWPFVAEGVFGGNFDLLTDPGVLSLLSPFNLLFSWISLTDHAYALVDAVSICNTFAIAGAFCWSALWLRRHFSLTTPSWMIVALTLSYTFSAYNLFIGSSWIGFLNPQASLPLILVGTLHPSARRGIVLQVTAMLFAFLGGHAHTFVMLCLFSGLTGLLVSWNERRLEPVLRVVAAGLITGLLVLPIVWKALTSFSGSQRGAGLSTAVSALVRFEWPLLITTLVAGPVASLVSTHTLADANDISRGLMAAGFSAMNLAAFMAAYAMIRSRRIHALTWVFVVIFFTAAMMVMRPQWMASLFAHIPIVRSLRWPFRELWVAILAAHLFLLVEGYQLGRREGPLLFMVGLLVMAPLAVLPPPTLAAFALDRHLLFTRASDRYWTQLQRDHGPVRMLVVATDTSFVRPNKDAVPFTLLGTHNFGSYFGFTSSMGYTFIPSIRRVSDLDPEQPHHPGGMFTSADAHAIGARHRDYWLVELESLRPPRWTVRTPDGRWRYQYDATGDSVRSLGKADN